MKCILFHVQQNKEKYIFCKKKVAEAFEMHVCCETPSRTSKYSSPRLLSPPRDQTILGLLNGWAYEPG